MADKTIGELLGINEVYDDSLIPVEQLGEARKMTGKQFRQFGEKAAEAYVQAAARDAEAAKKSASAAAESQRQAKEHAGSAETARQAIEDMTVTSDTLPSGSEATATKTAVGGSFNIHFGIPRGEQGATGPKGEQGIQGPEGPQGINGVAVASEGFYAFNVNDEGHLILSYTGGEAPDFSIHEDDGHLYMNIA